MLRRLIFVLNRLRVGKIIGEREQDEEKGGKKEKKEDGMRMFEYGWRMNVGWCKKDSV